MTRWLRFHTGEWCASFLTRQQPLDVVFIYAHVSCGQAGSTAEVRHWLLLLLFVGLGFGFGLFSDYFCWFAGIV